MDGNTTHQKQVVLANREVDEEEALEIILYGFIFLIIGLTSRMLCSLVQYPLNHHVPIVIAGFIIGELSYYFPRLEDPMLINHIGPLRFFYLYIPLLIFDGTFNAEVHYLKVMVYHFVLVVIPTLVVTSVIVTCIGIYLLPLDWNTGDFIMMVSMTMTSGPQVTKRFLSSMSAEHDLKMMLDSESILGNILGFTLYRFITLHTILRNFFNLIPFFFDACFGFILGIIIGKIMIFWLSKIFKDHVNQTAIVLAFIYSSYALCILLKVSGLICMLTMALVLAHKRASMTTQSITILNKFMELSLFMFTCVAAVQAGIYLATVVQTVITFEVFFIAVGFYILSSLLRAMVLFATYPLSRYYLHNWSHVYIMCACHLRTTYSCVFAFLVLQREQTTSVKILFSVTLIQILISCIVNYALATYVINVINRRTLSAEKAHMVEKAAKLLQDLKLVTSHSLKTTMFTADADWNTVNQYTKLKEDFMNKYKGKTWLMTKGSQSLIHDLESVRLQAIKQVVVAEKTCYIRQFEEGVLSRQSVLNLMIQVNEAIKLKQLVNPFSFISAMSNKNNFICRIEHDLYELMAAKPAPVFTKCVVTIVHLIDFIIVVYSLLAHYFESTHFLRQLLINLYNIIVFFFFFFSMIITMIQTRSFSSTGFKNMIQRAILFCLLIDLMFTAVPFFLFKENLWDFNSQETLATFIFIQELFACTRLLRLFHIIRFSTLLQKVLLEIVTKKMEQKIFIGCDMSVGFIKGAMETLRKANRIVEDLSISSKLKYTCHICRLILAQHLGLCQVDNPGVMLALKSKTAIRLTLNAQEQRLLEIKEMGLLGDQDFQIIQKKIESKMVQAQNFPSSIDPLGHKSVLLHLPWVDGNVKVANYIEENGHAILFNPNDIIVTQGYKPGGIFIILNGLVRVESILGRDSLQEDEQAEVSQRILNESSRKASYFVKSLTNKVAALYDSKVELKDFLVRGGVIGEMSTLTGKPGHKTYRCATYVETYFISHFHLIELMEGEPDERRPMRDLEMKLWRTVAIRQAVRIILSEISSGSLSRMLIYNRMSDSYIIDGNMTRVVDIVPTEVAAVILIQGYAKNYFSEARFLGPCIIPYYISKLVTEPESGPRVIFLCLKNSMTEEGTLMENLIHEELGIETENQSEIDDDLLTISSGSSDDGPHRRAKKSIAELVDKSVLYHRMFEASSTACLEEEKENMKKRFSTSI
ncbi:sodium/hydrogen exchanger 10-like isoform X2 [Physella acuta]|uniref:sodium/hydrogen exchanger 10-like isoform X1 n=1 Tax=Physella acuta TaxID=109671 RepID=UPI0027DD51B2|nr:sodium/hydrogen exchanger 10-like isoform X1 [Physella acuta]XP_059175556.1 sodium/hydrogen exchanger 10-like isoform X2 [Physella acuta]